MALKASLNIPTVATLDNTGAENFLSRLRVAHIDITSDDGLSVVFGGGLSLWELSKLYTLLSNYGEVLDLYFIAHKAEHNRKKIVF